MSQHTAAIVAFWALAPVVALLGAAYWREVIRTGKAYEAAQDD